jgi:hypothetical protein
LLVIFALLDPDPDPDSNYGSGSGSNGPIEYGSGYGSGSGSETLHLWNKVPNPLILKKKLKIHLNCTRSYCNLAVLC